ncbi:MAG TPA: radical SAM family heme chaperone HemW [Acidimicrobiia bacterium]|nr:radical SAM family heme chaperone HemW [Acidimicrobiia bacterium]
MALSVYVHIPFCSRRCDYCDFATWTDREDNVVEYIDAVVRQWEFSSALYGDTQTEPLTSIFFGGGTPNLIDADHIARIIETISDTTNITDATEITVESNPDHVTSEKMTTYKSAGVNRISLGIQSTQNHVLQFLGREHSAGHVRTARDIISQAGINNVSGDLIYGAANESMQDWMATLEESKTLDLSHISAYALGIEPGTPLGRAVAAQEKEPTDDDVLADKYEVADAVLSANGYEWYEISNWAIPGCESQHNLTYWRGGDVIALGCAAHGFTHNQRWSTPRHIDTYLERFSKRRNPDPLNSELFVNRDDMESITRDEEIFSLTLRTRQGVLWPQEVSAGLQEFIDEGFVVFDPADRRVSLSVKGRLMAHRIMVDLYEEYEQLVSVVE